MSVDGMGDDEIAGLFPQPPRECQSRTIKAISDAFRTKDILTVTLPCGAGKSAIMSACLELAAIYNKTGIIYTPRKLLTEQTVNNLTSHGIKFGVRAASMPELLNLHRKIQISSIQTEARRVIETKKWELHTGGVAIFDEAHLYTTGMAERIIRMHLEAGDKVVLVTATPVGLSHISPNLFIGATNEELQQIGAHVRAKIYTPWEFDLKNIRRVKTGEYKVGDVVKNIWSQQVIGPIFNSWRKYNPDGRMTLLFAPDVASSLGLCDYFANKGVSTAHIDSNMVMLKGKEYRGEAAASARKDAIAMWREGRIRLMTNRYVFREGIDVVELYHLILATPIGSLKGFVQTVGRVVRRSEFTPDHVLITDHGGACKEHGSPNRSINWNEIYHLNQEEISDWAEKKKKERKEQSEDPITCPHCGLLRKAGPTCPDPPVGCGQYGIQKRKVVIQLNGSLKEMKDEDLPVKRKAQPQSYDQSQWDRLYFMACASQTKHTFASISKIFKDKHGYWPRNLKRMPVDFSDMKMPVKGADKNKLR
jgi:superfamily II DNA or RNA helicase